MKSKLPIVFNLKDNFVKSEFIQLITEKFGFICENKLETTFCKIDSLGTTISLTKKKITIQGKLNKETRDLISKINSLNYLTLDSKNLKQYEGIFQPNNGLVICQECGLPSEIIKGAADQSGNPTFKCSCGHELNTNSPLLIARDRILPDLNILISQTLSRLINAGYFNGFEIIIPEYYDKYVDQCFSKGRKRSSFLSEKEELRKLKTQGMIRIQKYPYDGKEIFECNDEEKIEDDKVFGLAVETHSILFTADGTLRDKSSEHNLECIFFTQNLNTSAKQLSELSKE